MKNKLPPSTQSRKATIGVPVLLMLMAATGARAETHYVWTASPSPGAPYTSWATAAHDLQSAVDAAGPGDTVLATNGVYNAGGSGTIINNTYASNRVAVTNGVLLRSVNGPEVTTIVAFASWVMGQTNSMRGVYLSGGSSLAGFTVTGGYCDSFGSGGGILAYWPGGEKVTDCVISNNYANRYGGGVYQCAVTDSRILSNVAQSQGGGASACTLLRCVVADNMAMVGAGMDNCKSVADCFILRNKAEFPRSHGYNIGGGGSSSILSNCVVAFNRVKIEGSASGNCNGGGLSGGRAVNCTIVSNSCPGGLRGGGVGGTSITNCIVYWNDAENISMLPASMAANTCTIPALGTDCVTAPPLLADMASGDFRLTAGSPCIDAGSSDGAPTADLDGAPRPWDGDNNGTARVDIGAYEYTSPLLDTDQDGVNDRDEVVAGTNPADSNSVLRITSINAQSDGSLVSLTWPSAARRYYSVVSNSTLSGSSWTNVPGCQNVAGTGTTLTNTAASPGSGPVFFRITVRQ